MERRDHDDLWNAPHRWGLHPLVVAALVILAIMMLLLVLGLLPGSMMVHYTHTPRH